MALMASDSEIDLLEPPNRIRLPVTPVILPNVTEWTAYLPDTGAGSGSKSRTFWCTIQTYARGQNATAPGPLEHIALLHLGVGCTS